MSSVRDNLNVGQIVCLKKEALGYPMLNDPESDLGIGLVIEHGSKEFEDTKIGMVKVLWTRSNTKRWEFIDDLIVVVHK